MIECQQQEKLHYDSTQKDLGKTNDCFKTEPLYFLFIVYLFATLQFYHSPLCIVKTLFHKSAVE